MKLCCFSILLAAWRSGGVVGEERWNAKKISQRQLESGHDGFQPLSCNDPFSPCVNWSTKAYDPATSMVTIPCGECVIMDHPAESLDLPNGIDVQGKLVFPDGYKLQVVTPFLFVQGELEMTSSGTVSGNEDIKIVLTGDQDNYLVPHSENSARCGAGGCNVGIKPVVIAGGKLNVSGLPPSCPAWVKLKNVVESDLSSGVSAPSFVAPPTGCSTALFDIDFENGVGIGWPNHFYRNYGGTDAYSTDSSHTPGDTYGQFGGRSSTWNGPQTNMDVGCITPHQVYYLTAKARLTKPGGTSECQANGNKCLKATYYWKNQDGSQGWHNVGYGPQVSDGEWIDFVGTYTFSDSDVNPSSNPVARRIYFEGPESGVEIAIDSVKFFRAPAAVFPTGGGDVCDQLIINGDAETTEMHPLPFPFSDPWGGGLSVMSESDGGTTNHFYAVRDRKATWDTPNYSLLTGCLKEHATYKVSAKIRIHSSTAVTPYFQFKLYNPDGTESYPWLFSCSSQSVSDGWVDCSGKLLVDSQTASATKVILYFGTSDDSLSDLDFDDISFELLTPPIEGLIVADDTSSLANCWGPASEILLTSHNLNFDDVATSGIVSATSNSDGTTTLTLAEPSGMKSFQDNEGDFAVEVALLSRNIAFESQDNDLDKGGHLVVLHTPGVAQKLDGVKFRKFGQQGRLGRYPVHFHMCHSAEGSVVSRNLVIESNQRCFVLHGSHNVTLDSNVAYDTFGHCYMLEDSGEQDNTLKFNLGAVTKKPANIIRPEETDDTPSTFWLTNPMNTFEGNVAAGSEHSGFWFEMNKLVRMPTGEFFPDMNPSILPLTLFKDNVAHSNTEHGIKTYPGQGYDPEQRAYFINSKSFRNKQAGVFFHNSENLAILDGVYSDNMIQIDIDRSPSCTVEGASVVGFSDEYRSVVETTKSPSHCLQPWPIRGIELHTFWLGGEDATGSEITNTHFERFGAETGCVGASAMRVDTENKGYFDVRTAVSGLTFDSGSEPINACDAVYGGIDDVAVYDMDGSIMPLPGYIVADTIRMTTFANCNSNPELGCMVQCEGTCFRTMGLAVDSFTPDNVELEITDSTGTTTAISGYYDWPLDVDDNIIIAEHTKTHRSRRFFATLPAGGSYTAKFVQEGADYWPTYVRTQYEDPSEANCGPDFGGFTVTEPAGASCGQLIVNGDIEAGLDGWAATMGGLALVTEGSNTALTSEYRTSTWMGPAQYLDTRCMTLGDTYTVSAQVKVVENGVAFTCDPPSSTSDCPRLTVKLQDGTWQDENEHWLNIGLVSGSWSSGGWNTIQGTFTVSQQVATAQSVLVYSEGPPPGAMMILDDVSITLDV